MEDEYPQYVELSEELIVPTALYTAASNKDHTELARLLEISNDLINQRDNSTNLDWYTPIEIAIQHHDIASVKILLHHGADPKMRLPWREHYYDQESSSVTEAASLGFVDILRLLIENGGPVTSIVLYCAADTGRLECVKEIFLWLVHNDRNEFDDGVSKSTAVRWALRFAAEGWRDEIVKCILATGNPDKSAVDYALLGAVMDEVNHDDLPKLNCVRKGSYEEARRKRTEVVRLLLAAGADVEATDDPSSGEQYCWKPLHAVARQGSRAREIFDMLLERNAEVESLNFEGTGYEDRQTPLFHAVLADDAYFVERLLGKRAGVSQIDKNGRTLLHVSTLNNTPACSAIMSQLLALGLSPCTTDSRGKTALHEASSQGNVEAVRLLLSTDPNLITCKTSDGWTALHFAADGNTDQRKIDASTVLLSRGADINALTVEGWTILHRAITLHGYNDATFISFLLENGANVTATDDVESPVDISPDHVFKDPASGGLHPTGVVRQVRDSLLHLLLDRVDKHTTLILKQLLDRGANIESKDAQGRTPLLRAVGVLDVRSGLVEWGFRGKCMTELLEQGADINAKDNAGMGFEDCVKKRGYAIRMEKGEAVGLQKIPVATKIIQYSGPVMFGRGRGKERADWVWDGEYLDLKGRGKGYRLKT